MRNWTFILFIALLSASCNSIISSKPRGTLSEKQMTNILIDIHLTEAALRIADDSSSRSDDTTQIRIRFAQVFKKHKVDPDDFNVSLTYYLKHIDELDKIYVQVINSLTELDATLQPKSKQNTVNLSPEQRRILRKNIWYTSMNKSQFPEKIEYFSPLKYPVPDTELIKYPKPLNTDMIK